MKDERATPGEIRAELRALARVVRDAFLSIIRFIEARYL
jgi:hypothetical protein